jgi:hypothetical protein
MELALLVVGDGCSIDRGTNRASVFNLLEEIPTPTFPIAIYAVSVFTLWIREEGEPDTDAQLRVFLNEVQLRQTPLPLRFEGTSRCRNVTNILGLVLSGPGTLHFDVLLIDRVVGTWKIPVRGLPQVVEAQPQPPA